MDNIIELDLKHIKALQLNRHSSDFLKEFQNNKDFFDIIFEIVKNVYSDTARYYQYFEKYNEQIKYELYMKIYDTLFLTRKINNPSNLKLINYIKAYAEKNPTYQSTLQQLTSKIKYDMTNDYEQMIFYNNDYYARLRNYWNIVYIPLKQGKLIDYSPILSDIIFNIKNYNGFIYNKKKYEHGIDIVAYHSLALEFASNHKYTNTFEHEYSTYVFEKMHGMIGFQRCFYNYLQSFGKKKINIAYFPLYEYTKLFDTMYPSITDYALETYADTINSLYKDSDIISHKELFVVIQFLNRILLPRMYLTIEHLLFSVFVKKYSLSVNSDNEVDLHNLYSSAAEDFKVIEEKLKMYLESKSNNYRKISRYSHRLDDINQSINECNYNFCKKSILDNKTLKTGSTVQIFNHSLSLCFYMKSLPNFTFDGNVLLSNSDCFKALSEYFDLTYFYFKDKTLYSCDEYINCITNKK